jgi:hypothetical protein
LNVGGQLGYDTERTVSLQIKGERSVIDNTQALERIEQAEREAPFCVCGAHTVPVGRPSGVWLACASLEQPKGLVRKLLTLDFAASHTNRRIVELSALDSAA